MRLILTSILLFQLVMIASSQQQSPETCQALLDSVSGVSALTGCSANTPECTAVMCSVPTFSLDLTLTLLPCNTPIAIQIIASDSQSGTEVGNMVVDESQTVVLAGQSAEITLEQVDGGIILEVNIQSVIGPIPLISNTMIPIDTSSCQVTPITEASTAVTVQSTAVFAIQPTTALPYVTTTAEPSLVPIIPTATPNTEPPSETTCEALMDVVANLDTSDLVTCRTNRQTDCNAIVCSSVILGTMTVTILRCEVPPAIEFKFVDSDGEDDIRTFTSSGTTSVAETLVLDITLDQLPLEDAIGLQVTAQLAGQSLTIVEYTVIPLESDRCGDGGSSGGESASVSTVVVATFLSLPLLITALLN